MSAALWNNRRVMVCVGTGGVGKTTVAAAIALAAAASGRRVAVMTIDPSKRLSQALGIDANSPQLQPVSLEPLKLTLGQSAPGGSLHALMLDVQHTFDSLIRARARTPQDAEAILGNRIYKHFSASLAGSHEYAAVEKLYDVFENPDFDLVVLDTPPSHHALDFLDAPGRILRFLQGQEDTEGSAQAAPSLARRMGRKLFDLGGSLVTRTVGKVSGAQTLSEVTSFLSSLKNMYASFSERAAKVEALLRSDKVAFTLVGGPSQAQILALEHFAQELARFHIRPAAWVLNRVHPAFVPAQRAYGDEAIDRLVATRPELSKDAPALRQAMVEEAAMADRDQEQLRALRTQHPDATLVTLADEAQGADSIERLGELCRALLGA